MRTLFAGLLRTHFLRARSLLLRPQVKGHSPAALSIALVPSNSARLALYRLLFGHEIDANVTVGWGTVLDAQSAHLETGASIGSFCRFTKVGHLRMHPNSTIGHKNVFNLLPSIEIGEDATLGYNNYVQGASWLGNFDPSSHTGSLTIGTGALIVADHFFDTSSDISIGERTTLAGHGSSLFTHGVSMSRGAPLAIGDDCYVGSGTQFAPGASIGDHCLVGLGSVVTRAFPEPHAVLGGNPATVMRRDERPQWKPAGHHLESQE